jgi:hypothetical protein
LRRDAANAFAKRDTRAAATSKRTMSRERRGARTLAFRNDPNRRRPGCVDRAIFCERICERMLAR